MCSATHVGILSRLSWEETREWRVARSLMGPGKPYWKRPAGSTKGFSTGRGTATGAGTEVVDVAETLVEEAAACTFVSARLDNIAAVTLAPVAALTAAIIANVAFDILARGGPRGGFGVCLFI